MLVTLDHTEPVAHDVQTFWFKPTKSVDYIAGQFIELFLPHDNPDERGIKHWFTLSSSPTDDMLSITTKFAPERSSTFKQTLFGLKPGAEVKMSEPMGDFVLPKDTTIPLIFVAAGIGITPMHSMVKWLSDMHEQRSIHLLYGAQTEADVAFRELFEQYGTTLELMISKPNPGSTPAARITSTRILELTHSKPNSLVYISGPEPMVETLEKELLRAGIENHRLVLDFFPNYRNL